MPIHLYYSRVQRPAKFFCVALIVLTFPSLVWGDTQLRPLAKRAVFRRPVAVAAVEPCVVVANQRSDSISVIDVGAEGILRGEYRMAGEPVDVAALPAPRQFAVLCRAARRLRVVQWLPDGIAIAEELRTPFDPVRVAVHTRGRMAVTARWSRQVALYQRVQGRWKSLRTVDLPFAPRAVLFHPDGRRLVVADAFGPRVAELSWSEDRPIRFCTIEGHGITDLAVSHDQTHVLMAHRVLQPHVRTLRERIFWGNVINNFVRGVAWAEFEAGTPNPNAAERPIAHWNLLTLGEPSHGTGDPTAISVASSGAAVVCLGGVDEVALRPAPRQPMQRFSVGRYPTAVACTADGHWAYVANRFDDSITVIDLQRQQPVRTIRLGPQPVAGPIERGESLFHDARLAHDGWFSCQSCHIDGHTNHQRNDNLGDGTYGAPKRVLSLLGVADTAPWSWLGTQDLLAAQVEQSILTTMRGPESAASRANVDDLTAYLRTLQSPPGVAVARERVDARRALRGERVFHGVGCAECHRPPTYTSTDLYHIGIEDELGHRDFSPPSLRGVSQRDRLLHDGRASGVREAVLAHENIDLSALSPDEFDALLHFLDTL